MSASSASAGSPAPLHLAVALDAAGWHPAAWRRPGARPDEYLTARYWLDQVAEAERGLLDFATFEDALSVQSDRPDRVQGRLDAVLTAARVAPRTRHLGLVPSATATHTEPFHLSKAIATLDYASTGRAGVRVQVTNRQDEADHFGRRDLSAVTSEELLDEAADWIEVLRRLWDSWEDDAEIRDSATGRFVDREKLHYIDFEGRYFSVRGPSITPRPPQGQPLVSALAHGPAAYRLIGRSADVGFVAPGDAGQARAAVEAIRAAQEEAGRGAQTLHVLGDLVVFLDKDERTAADRRARLDELSGEPFRSDAQVFTGTPAQLADLLREGQASGLSGYRLRPAELARDLPAITRGLVPELQARGAFRRSYEADTLRGLLGLARPANRYAAQA